MAELPHTVLGSVADKSMNLQVWRRTSGSLRSMILGNLIITSSRRIHLIAPSVVLIPVVSRLTLTLSLIALGCGWSGGVVASTADELIQRFAQQRAVFLQAIQSLSEGSIEGAQQKLTELAGYPLQDHLEYLLLRRRIEGSKEPLSLLPEVQAFYKTQKNQRSHRRLLGSLKGRLAKLEKWRDYKTLLALDNAPVHPCDDLYTRVYIGGQKKFDRAARELWTEPHRHTDQCERAYEILIKAAGDVPTSALWQRTIALLIKGQFDEVEALLPFFGKRDKQIVQFWLDNKDNPARLLQSESSRGSLLYHRKLVRHLMRRWSREDLPAASQFWARNGVSLGHKQKQVTKDIGKYAVLAALRNLPEAHELLKDADTAVQSVRYWRVRVALQSGQWSQVLSALNQLTTEEQASTRWRYWRARALQAQGFASAAQKIYKSLAGEFQYYGFLAADKLYAEYSIEDTSPAVDQKLVADLAGDEGIRRAIEFFLVDIGWEGRREWNQALQETGENKLLAAADLALSVGWYDRAYASINKTTLRNALRYKFLMPRREYVQEVAASNSIAEELVYAVMRRESAYIADVRSTAGAVGLMQLMPATAREVANKLGIKVQRWQLIEGDTNIQLGASYLAEMHQKFNNNMVLASAAYNAGPNRVSTWLPETTLAADVWVETIPFDETRSYIKAVLFNFAVLQWQLSGDVQTRLHQIMQDIKAAEVIN